MSESRRFPTVVVLVALAATMALAAAPGPALGQETIAEVRTWAGESWRLGQPVLERISTIVLGEEETASPERRPPFARLEMALPGSPAQPSTPGKPREIRTSRSSLDTLTLHRGGTQVRVPVAGLSVLLFTRQAIPGSPLPPHVAAGHLRHAAMAIMTDGSRIEGDYVNLGLTVLRGMSREGRVEIPWYEIESIRFVR
jgi:hypothetical protein